MPPDGELRAAIVQDADTGRVLMLAWMDAEAERRTRESEQKPGSGAAPAGSTGTRARPRGTRWRSNR